MLLFCQINLIKPVKSDLLEGTKAFSRVLSLGGTNSVVGTTPLSENFILLILFRI